MFVTVVLISKALTKATPWQSFDGQQQKSGFFSWRGGLEAPLLVSRPVDCFVTQNLDMLPEKLATVPGDTAMRCMYFKHVNILYDARSNL